MADKDVEELTEATAGANGTAPGPAEPVDAAAQAETGKSDLVQSEVAQSGAAQPEDSQDSQAGAGQSDLVQSEVAQSEVGQPGDSQDSQAGAGQSDLVQSEVAQSEVGQPGETAPSGRRGWRIAAAFGAVTVVLGGFGVWATLHAASLRSDAAAQNTALTDGPATAAVRREVSAAVNTIFSYSYANTAFTKQAAQGVLTGPAVRQYNTLFALVTKNAPAQKLIVTTRVTNSGVELLSGDRARVLVFANQQDTRAGTGQTSYAGAMFAVTALSQGGRWKIENIDTFSG